MSSVVRWVVAVLGLVLIALGLGYLARPRPIPVSRHQQVLDGPCLKLDLACGDGRVLKSLGAALSCQEIIVVCHPKED